MLTLPPFKAFLASNIPSVYDNTLTYYEELVKLIAYLENEVVPAINKTAAEVDGVLKAFNELKDYVDHYFDNLDVQEEINNKLDEMAEGGQLEAIIAQFLEVAPVFAYGTIADMAASTSLIAGCTARVLGDTTASDGDGAYYLVRAKEEGETGDGVQKVEIGDTLIADRIPDGNLDEAVSSINSQITSINTEIDKITSKKTHNIKFVGNDESYYPECELSSSYNGLGFEGLFALYGSSAELGVQGIALWERTGKLIFNNGTQIYTLSQANDPTQSILWTGNYGHGGDSCILGDNLYIADMNNTAIYKVDLNNGNKTTYSIPATSIKNATQNYTPVLAGVCGNEPGLLYIVACDPENNDHTIKTGSTVRIYTFDTNTNEISKIFEMPQDTCYVQGMTKDEEFFYVVGNKPFSGSYAGSIMTIITADNMEVFDKISNNSDYENEGLDFGSYEGMSGLITVCGKYGVRLLPGMYSFYGNQTKLRTMVDNAEMTVKAIRSRSGVASVFFQIRGTFDAGDNTYSYENMMKNAFPVRTGSGGFDFCPIQLTGDGRNFNAIGIWDYNDTAHRNRFRVLEREGSSNSTTVNGHIVYISI